VEKGTAVEGVTKSGQNVYKFVKTMERYGHVIPTLALSHIAHPLQFVAFIEIKGKEVIKFYVYWTVRHLDS